MVRMLMIAALCGGVGAVWGGSGVHAKSRWGPGTYQCDLEQSELRVWISKKGLLSSVGHNVVFKVHDWTSRLTMTPEGDWHLGVEVAAASIAVASSWSPAQKDGTPGFGDAMVHLKPLDSWSTRQIEGSMRGKDVLDVAKYPTIVFEGHSSRNNPGLQFQGNLTLKGTTRPLDLSSSLNVVPHPMGPHVTLKGETTFLQSNWGIRPYSVMLGSLQLKDEVTVQWEVHYASKVVLAAKQ